MKVLFAVNNEKISEAIIKKYQTMYKEIISWKNVYFFNAIIKELQKDKSYDRIVIGEDLEPYANNNYEVIDNLLFDKLDSISDEASNSRDGDIPIILIATDRRERGNSLLVKLFGIGIYNVLLGQDRKIDNVCQLIYQPRTKKEAKAYYRIDSDDVNYQEIDPESVSEVEIQNILTHYKKLGKNEDRYVESFEEIATQYTDAQLKLITRALPLNVRAVLEEKCPKYQQVMIGSVKNQVAAQKKSAKQFTSKNIQSKNINKIELIDRELQKSKLTKPVVIPSTINMQNVKKAYTMPRSEEQDILQNIQPNTMQTSPERMIPDFSQDIIQNDQPSIQPNIQQNIQPSFQSDFSNNFVQNNNATNFENNAPFLPNVEPEKVEIQEQNAEPIKKGRGRPKKEKTPEEIAAEEAKEKKGRGRPRKNVEQPLNENTNASQDVNLFEIYNQNNAENNVNDVNNVILPGLEEETKDVNGTENQNLQINSVAQEDYTNVDFFGNKLNRDFNPDFFGNEAQVDRFPGAEEQKKKETKKIEPIVLNKDVSKVVENIKNDNIKIEEKPVEIKNNDVKENINANQNIIPNIEDVSISMPGFEDVNNGQNNNQIEPVKENINYGNSELSNLITGDKKIVAFVGTSKNGTSFLVNNLAAKMSNKGIKTAILDLTKNKNAYYIYTLNEDALREKAFDCIEKLRRGVADGIQVNKNLSVYTTLPGENLSLGDYKNVLETLVRNYSLVLLDCDFDTDSNYFASAQELYLVQTYDILTIQPLTAFLNELKYKNILDQNKLRIVINKTLKLKRLTDKMIIAGISCYNDPASTYINTLFDRDHVRYTTIPFENQTYARYLERLVDCEISLNGYSKMFLEALERLGNMVYPLIANNPNKYQPGKKNFNDYSKNNKNVNTAFNSNMNATLNKMRNNF